MGVPAKEGVQEKEMIIRGKSKMLEEFPFQATLPRLFLVRKMHHNCQISGLPWLGRLLDCTTVADSPRSSVVS